MNISTSRLAAHLGTANIELHHYIERKAEKVASIIDRYAEEIAELYHKLQFKHPYYVEQVIRRHIENMHLEIGKNAYDELFRIGNRAVGLTSAAIVKAVPKKYFMQFAVAEADGGAILRAVLKPFKRKEPEVKLQPPPPTPNVVIPPMKKSVLEKIILGGAAAISRLMRVIKTAINPKKLADTLIKSVSRGKNRREQVRDLIQEMGVSRSAAKRIVRTEGLRVATESNMASYEKLGTDVIGYQIHAVLDQVTRPAHRFRNGTVYYKDPLPGQKSVQEMPRPPIEPDGSIAWNCRCFVSPIWGDLEGLNKRRILQNASNIIPDPLIYNDWWQTAPDAQRKIAVGARRYAAGVKKYGRKASYYYYIDDRGNLLSVDFITNEDPTAAKARVDALRIMMMELRKQRRDALLWGSV